MHGRYPSCEGLLDGHESSIDDESSKSGEEDEFFEEELMEEFMDWSPELLFIPQYRRRLHHKKGKYEEGESSVLKDKKEHYGEGGGQQCVCPAAHSTRPNYKAHDNEGRAGGHWT